MGTIGTKRTGTATVLSSQARAYKRSDANGYVLTGPAISSSTSIALDITTPGLARSFTSVTGGTSGPAITGLTYLDQNNLPTSGIAVSTLGGNLQITGTGFTSSDVIYINNTQATKVFGNTTTLYATVPAGSTGNVTVAVFNTSNIGSLSNSAMRYSGSPTWVTSAAIGMYNNLASNIALESTSDSAVTYSLKAGSGSLPTGISLASAGYLSGTPTGYTVDTIFSFILIATDAEGQGTQKGFNLTVFLGDTYFKQTTLLLQGDTTTFISDASTNNFLITRYGDTRPSRLSPYWPGGWSAYFDGTGDYLTVPDNATLDMGSSDCTIECWFYPTTTPNNNLFSKRATSATYGGLGILFTTSLTPTLLVTVDGATWGINQSSTISCNLNSWNHIAVVRNGSNWKLFVNGQYGVSATLAGTIPDNSAAFAIGAAAADGGTITSSYISNFRVVKGTALYTANFTPSTTALTTVANTSLLTLRDSTLTDASPINSVITRNGDTKLTTFSPFNTAPHTFTANSSSVYFDGTGDYLSVASGSKICTGDFTVEAWFYNTGTPTSGEFGIVGGSAYQGAVSALGVYNGNLAYLKRLSNGNGSVLQGSAVPTNRWCHVALTRSGSTIRIFLDGTQVATTTLSETFNFEDGGTTRVGAHWGTNGVVGYLSDVRIINGTALYTSTFTVPSTILTAVSNTVLLICQQNTTNDYSSVAATVTPTGDARVSKINPFGETATAISNYTWSAASYGSSGYFDGTGDYLSVANNAAFNFGSGNFTIECWAYRMSNTDGQIILSYGWPSISEAPFFIYYDGTNDRYSFYSSSATAYDVASGVIIKNTPPLYSWGHIAIARSGNTIRCFFNGVLGSTTTSSLSLYNNTTQPLTIAARSTGAFNFNGYLQDLRITKGTALYTTTFIPPTAPLSNVANVSLLTLQSDISSSSFQFVDQSPHNHLVTRSGNATQGSLSPLNPTSWSAYFDGSGDYLSASANSVFDITGDFTIEAWVYFTALPGTNVGNSRVASIAGYSNGSTANAGWEFYVDFTGNIFSIASWGSGNSAQCSFTPALNTWYHFSATKSGSTSRLFINGINQTLTVNTLTINNGSSPTLNIGRSSNNTQYFHYVPGYISNFRIVKGTALYTANFTPATTTLSSVANTSLLCLGGPTLTDSGPNNFAITRNGDVKITPFGPFSPHTVTPRGYSVYFDGTGDYLSVADNAVLRLGTGDFTIEFWWFPNSISGYQTLFDKGYNSAGSLVIQTGNGNGTLIIYSAAVALITASSSSSVGSWDHYALVRNGTSLTLYRNGIGVGTATNSTNFSDTGLLNIGGSTGGGGYYTNGYLSNFRILKGTALYTATFTPSTTTLTAVANTSLLTCHTTTLVDGSSNAFAITQNGDARPSRLNPFGVDTTLSLSYVPATYGGSVYLDGDDYISLADSPGVRFDSGDFTMECWFCETGVTATGAPNLIWWNGNSNSSAYAAIRIQLNSARSIGLLISTSGSSWAYNADTANGVYDRLSWNHLAVTRSGNTFTLFVNGKSQLTTTVSGALYAGTVNYLGNMLYSASTWYYNGYVSNFRFIKGTALYTSNFVPPTSPGSPTTANTSLLLNFTSSGVVDSTGRSVLETIADARSVSSLSKYSTGSLYFDGTGDYLSIPYSEQYALEATDFTIEAWVYRNVIGAEHNVAVTRSPSVADGWNVRINSTNTLQFYYTGGSSVTSTGTIAATTWTHIAVTRSGTTVRLFINGTIDGSATFSNGTANSQPLRIGVDNANTGGYMNGYIDDLRITKGYARYTANFTPPTTALLKN